MAADTVKGFTSIRKYENDYPPNGAILKPGLCAATRA